MASCCNLCNKAVAPHDNRPFFAISKQLNFKDATGLKIDHAELTGAEIHAPGAEIDKVTGHTQKLKSEYTQIGLSLNPMELVQSFGENSEEQNKDSNPITMINLPFRIVRKEAEQRSVVTGATVRHKEGKVASKREDGYKIKNDTKIDATVVIPVTDKERIERFKGEVKEAYGKVEETVKKSFSKFFAEDKKDKIIETSPHESVDDLGAELDEPQTPPKEKKSEEQPISATAEEIRVPLQTSVADSEAVNNLPEEEQAVEILAVNASNENPQSCDPQKISRGQLFMVGMKGGAIGAVLPDAEPIPSEHGELDTLGKLSFGIGNVAGDLPVIVATGKAIGVLTKLFKATPGGTVVSAVAGAVVFSVPTFIREVRTAYNEHKSQHPEVRFKEFVAEYGVHILKETGKSAAAGAIVGLAGTTAKNTLASTRLGRTLLVGSTQVQELTTAGKAIKTAVDITTTATVPQLVAGQLPTLESFTDNVLIIGAMHGVQSGAAKVMAVAKYAHEQAKYYPLPKTITLNDPAVIYELKYIGLFPCMLILLRHMTLYKGYLRMFIAIILAMNLPSLILKIVSSMQKMVKTFLLLRSALQ